MKSYIRRITDRLTTLGYKTVILTQMTKKDHIEKEIVDGIEVVRFDCGDLVDRSIEFYLLSEDERKVNADKLFRKDDIENAATNLAYGLKDFIIKHKPKVIHFHNSYFLSPYALYILKQVLNFKTLTSFYFWSHSPPFNLILPDGSKSSLYEGLKSFQNHFKAIFSISKSVQNHMLKHGIDSKVKYLGIDTNVFKKRNVLNFDIRKKKSLSNDAFLVLYAGRIIKDKGLDNLPEIYKKLIARDKAFLTLHFLFIGDGKYRYEFENLVKEQNLDHRFHFDIVDSDDQLVDIYSNVNCFILPSRREALGLSLLEAMSCSLPCIASDLSGINEIIKNKKNGILVPLDNLTEYVRWISSLYLNENLRNELGKAARLTVEEEFSFDNHVRYFIKRLLN